MGPRCSSAETQVCHRSYIIAATAIHVLEYTKSLTSLGQFPVSIDFHISIRDVLSKTNREDGFLNIFQKIKLKTAKIKDNFIINQLSDMILKLHSSRNDIIQN